MYTSDYFGIYKTYYLGCEDDGSIAEIDASDLVYVNSVGAFGWCDPLSKISSVFMDAELKAEFNECPSRISMIVPDYIFEKRKEEDQYISYERIEFILNNFQVPTNGCVVSVYVVQHEVEKSYLDLSMCTRPRHFEWPFQTNTVWKTKEQWNGSGDYVTLQLTEKNSFTKNGNKLLEDAIIRGLDRIDQRYELVDYTMKCEDVYELMLSSQLHISYVGASWWLSHYMGVPVFDYGEHVHQSISTSIFGVLGAPGMGKNRAQVLYENGKFTERKMNPVASVGYEWIDHEKLDDHVTKLLIENID